jgi:hypothetical protein
VCPDTAVNGDVSFYISISQIDDCNYNTTTNIDGLILAFLVRLL